MQIETIDHATGERSLSPEFEQALSSLWDRHRSDQDDAASGQRTVQAAQAGILGGLSDIEFFGIPVGEALGGGAIALIAGEALDGVLGEQTAENRVTRGVVKLISGGVLASNLGNFLSPGLARAGAMFLAFDATRDMLPIDDMVRDLFGFFQGSGGGGEASQQVLAGQHTLNSALNSGSEEELLDRAMARAAA